MDCSIEIRKQRVMWSVGTGHGFLTESQGFRIGTHLRVDTSNVLILQMRKQRLGKTECSCSLEQCGLQLGFPDSQWNAFSLYPSTAIACWHRHSRNKTVILFFCIYFRHSCPLNHTQHVSPPTEDIGIVFSLMLTFYIETYLFMH